MTQKEVHRQPNYIWDRENKWVSNFDYKFNNNFIRFSKTELILVLLIVKKFSAISVRLWLHETQNTKGVNFTYSHDWRKQSLIFSNLSFSFTRRSLFDLNNKKSFAETWSIENLISQWHSTEIKKWICTWINIKDFYARLGKLRLIFFSSMNHGRWQRQKLAELISQSGFKNDLIIFIRFFITF